MSVRPATLFDHQAFVYDSDEEYAATLGPLLADAVATGAVPLAVVPTSKAAVLRDALDGDAESVEFISAEDWYCHPLETIAAYDDRLRAAAPGSCSFVIGEVQFGVTFHDWIGWIRYEAALNRALAHHEVRVICPYDRAALPATVIAHARRTHPKLIDGLGARVSDSYFHPGDLVATLPATVAVPVRSADAEADLSHGLRPARQEFARIAARAGFDDDRCSELVLGLNEVLTNVATHGGGQGLLRTWAHPGAVTCVVDNNGPGADPLLGFDPPVSGAESGYGLWIARRMFDRADVVNTETGVRVALYARAATGS